jgi:hypothetical protein
MFNRHVPSDPEERLEYHQNRHIKIVSKLEKVELSVAKWNKRSAPLQKLAGKLALPVTIVNGSFALSWAYKAAFEFSEGSTDTGFAYTALTGLFIYFAQDSFQDYRKYKEQPLTEEDELLIVPQEWLDNPEDL